jgi:DNA polymerase III epsilon subunit family exonuclease
MHSVVKTNLDWKLSSSEEEILFRHFPAGIIAIDLETTGLSPLVDKIIEIAAIKMTREGTEIFETLINPEIPIPPHTIEIHNISDDMVKNAPKIQDVLPKFKIFLGDVPIVAHNAKFDLGFIVFGFQKLELTMNDANVFCSCKLSRTTHPDFPNHKLATLVKEHQIPLLNHHRASDDAYASLRVFIEGLKIIKPEYLNKTGLIFNMKQFDAKHEDQLPKFLLELESLVQTAAVVEIKYNGGSVKNEFRPIKLTSLLNTPDGNFLYAKCLLTDIYKSFKIKKIQGLRKPSAENIQKWLKKHE